MSVRIGIIGTGQMGSIHARAAQDAPGAELVAVAGGTRAPELARRMAVPVEPSVDALLARTDIDALVISTPHTSHLPLVRDAAESGRHVLLEKPMGVSLADCDAMIAACETARVRLMVAHVTRFLEAVSRARRLIDEGAIGEPRMILAERLVDGYPLEGWPLDPAQGSSFLDWGSHGCDIVRWLMGTDPTVAFGRQTTFRDGPGTGLSAMAAFGFDAGRMATVWQSYEMPGPGVLERARYAVVGSAGTLDIRAYGELAVDRNGTHEVDYTAPDYRGRGAAADMDSPTFRGAFQRQMEEFASAIADGRDPDVGGPDGRAAVAMVLAAEASAASGTAVPISL